MKVLKFSRHFPKGHAKAGQPTWFVEKVLNNFREHFALPDSFKKQVDNYTALLKGDEYLQAVAIREVKHHTIRAGSSWKAGDMASLRVWSDKPYRSKQIEFAQVEIRKVWEIEISEFWFINNNIMEHQQVIELAKNDGLEYADFVNWFTVHPKKKDAVFRGQIICWSDKIDYTGKPDLNNQ